MRTKYLFGLFFFPLFAFGQNRFESHVNISFGTKVFSRQETPVNIIAPEVLDFMLLGQKQVGEEVLNVNTRFRIGSKSAVDIQSSLYSDLRPRSINLTGLRKLNKILGIGVGLENYAYFFNTNREKLYPTLPSSLSNFYYNFSEPFIQIKRRNTSVFVSPIAHFTSKWMTVEVQSMMGLNTFGVFRLENVFRVADSFELYGISYQTKRTFNPFIRPIVRLAVLPIVFKNSSLGFRVNWQTTLGNRAINYKQIDYRWLPSNRLVQQFQMPKRFFKVSQLDWGLHWQW